MATIIPFKAYRPAKGLEAEIAALPYDVYNREEAVEIVKKNPRSFLAIDRAETQFGPETDIYAPEVYAKAKEMMWQEIEEGCFFQDEKPCYYLYRQIMDGRSQTGIVACASIDDYQNQVIKKHEKTRADKEEDRIRHVDTCDAQSGPIFLAYRAQDSIRVLIEEIQKDTPEYDFTTEDAIRHTVWIISDLASQNTIRGVFEGLDSIYIADGHHRCASAAKVGLMRRAAQPNYTGKESFNFFLAVLFPDEELKIMDYNRVVKDLNGLSEGEFLTKISGKFDIHKVGEEAYHPKCKGNFGMYLSDCWYELTAKPEILSRDPVEGLDVSLLQNHLLSPVLGIGDPKTDKRIDFVGGIRGLKELERRVHTDMKVAFSMYPTSIEELFAVADDNRLMPPKSTWFEPKLRSGLFLHGLSGMEEI